MDAFGFAFNIVQTAGAIITCADRVKEFQDVPQEIESRLALLQISTRYFETFGRIFGRGQGERAVLVKDTLKETMDALQSVRKSINRWEKSIRQTPHKQEKGSEGKVEATPGISHLNLLKFKVAMRERRSKATEKIKRMSGVLISRTQWIIKGKEMLDEKIKTLNDWRSLLESTLDLYQLMITPSLSSNYLELVKASLKRHQESKSKEIIPLAEFIPSTVPIIPFSDAVGWGNDDSSYESHIVVRRFCSEKSDMHEKREEAKKLVRSLTSIPEDRQAEDGIFRLTCVGYALQKESTKRNASSNPDHALIFRVPSAFDRPRTLRDLLLASPEGVKINHRLQFAISLTTSVIVNHSLGLVHKSINPESIVVFRELTDGPNGEFPRKVGEPCLLSFDDAREERTATGGRAFENNFRRRVYCHPDHLRTERIRKFEMRDDIYSLGVCLLEIGLWKSLFEKPEGYSTSSEGMKLSGWANCLEDWQLRQDYKEPSAGQQQTYRLRKAALQGLAEQRLPLVMGDKYASAVLACLRSEPSPRTGLDQLSPVEEGEGENCSSKRSSDIDSTSDRSSPDVPDLPSEIPGMDVEKASGFVSFFKKIISSVFKMAAAKEQVSKTPSPRDKDESLHSEVKTLEMEQVTTTANPSLELHELDSSVMKLLESVLTTEGYQSVECVLNVLQKLEGISV